MAALLPAAFSAFPAAVAQAFPEAAVRKLPTGKTAFLRRFLRFMERSDG
jgi:hypothetical protein